MNRIHLYRACLNSILLLTLFSLGLFLNSNKPFERGFFCEDESIKYPFKKSDTVSPGDLALISLLLPLLTIVSSEFILYLLKTKKLPFRDIEFAFQTFSILSDWFLATCITFILTDFIKNMVGRLRPMFMDACRPDVDCKSQLPGQYFTDFNCKRDTKDSWPLKELRRSFPSGHASESMVAMAYIAIYLHKRFVKEDFIRYFVIVLQLLYLMIAVFTGLSRIQDYRHHWSDVLAGFALGGSVALVTAKLTGKLDDLIIGNKENKQQPAPGNIPVNVQERDIEAV